MQNFALAILSFEIITIALGFVVGYATFLIFSILDLVESKFVRKCLSSRAMQWLMDNGTAFLAYVIKVFLPDNVYSASLENGTTTATVVVVNGFILEPKQVFKLSAAIIYIVLAFLLIVIRNSFITEEFSKFSACFSGGLADNRTYTKCLIFHAYDSISDKNISELTANDCANLNCEQCPDTTLDKYGFRDTILCLQSTPDVVTALAGLVGLVKVTQLILSIYSGIMNKYACWLVRKSLRGVRCGIYLWLVIFNVLIVIGSVIILLYLIFKKGGPLFYMDLCELWLYYVGLTIVIRAIPWHTSSIYIQENKLEKEKVENSLFKRIKSSDSRTHQQYAELH